MKKLGPDEVIDWVYEFLETLLPNLDDFSHEEIRMRLLKMRSVMDDYLLHKAVDDLTDEKPPS